MEKKILSANAFAQVANKAKNEIKGTFGSPFVIINLLNKAAKGDFSKIANCEDLQRANVAKVAAEVKKLHTGRYSFDISVLPRAAYNGRLGWWSPVPAQQCELASILCGEVVLCTDPKWSGRELSVREGKVGVFRAIPLTVGAIFAAYCTIVRRGKVQYEKAAKAAAKAAKEESKAAAKLAKARTIVTAVFGELAHTFSDSEIIEKAAIIKAAK